MQELKNVKTPKNFKRCKINGIKKSLHHFLKGIFLLNFLTSYSESFGGQQDSRMTNSDSSGGIEENPSLLLSICSKR